MRSPPFVVFAALALAAPVLAKLPSLGDEAKAKAAVVAAQAAWSDKVGAFQLCQSMERVAEGYRKSAASSGKAAPAASPTAACSEPGPFVAPLADAASKPLEAAGAHSPAGMAVSPPSGKATAAELTGGPKK